jgi:ubiquinone/menaquinone biosynthesis C-methylase UbiE
MKRGSPLSHKFPQKEYANTYWVQDRTYREETARLQLQGQMITAGMGGVLPEQPQPTTFQRVLDVGCGTGDWLIEVAKTYPGIPLLVGIDVNERMVHYARSQAKKQQVADRVEFHVMDALCTLKFPEAFFDLVNERLGMSYLRTWDWPNLLSEFQRITRPGGVIRITECDTPESNSPALNKLNTLLLQALSQSGHFFIPNDRNGVISELAPLLERLGLKQVQTHLYRLEYRAGTPEGKSFCEDEEHMFRLLLPFFHKWCRVPEDYETIYRQALDEMQQPDFAAKWTLLTVCGINS